MEHVDLVGNATHYIEEWYDFESNILAVTNSWSSAFIHNIFYFDMNTVVALMTERGACVCVYVCMYVCMEGSRCG